MLTAGLAAAALVAGRARCARPRRESSRPPPQEPQRADAGATGVREAAWSPDGKRLAATWFDAIWTMTPDGKDPKRVVPAPQGWAAERDPAWSPDGKSIAFSASTNGEFDLWIAPAARRRRAPT